MPLAVLSGVRLDLRAALRSMSRSPGFFLGAVLTLGLGLGAVTTAFGLLAGALGDSGLGSSVDPVVLSLTERANGREQRMRWPYAGVRHLRENAQSFARIATYTIGTLNLTGTRESARSMSSSSRPNTSMSPASWPCSLSGRAAGSAAEIVIGHALWQRLVWRHAVSARPDADPVARALDDRRRDAGRLPRPQRTGRGFRAAHHVAAHQLRGLLHVTGVFPQRHRDARSPASISRTRKAS